ncbi:dUTPase-like protein, partial [Syncephalis pseudoplumigaleata]
MKYTKSNCLLPDLKCAYEQAAGFDLPCAEAQDLLPGIITKISTGISIEPPPGYYIQLYLRSSAAQKGLLLQGGVIDPDYRGIIHFIIYNLNSYSIPISAGDYLVQGILIPHTLMQPICIEQLPTTLRQDQGFGSS